MRAVDRRFTFWMAGYYDDFLGAVALPDDLNDPSLDYKSHKTHAGNAITGYAPMNPRYAHAFVEREDGATGRFNNAALTGGAQYKVNAGIHDWLGFDANRRAAGTYVGKAQLQFPDSITNANRQKYDAGADYGTIPQEGYLMFCNGYDTTGRYYAAIGTDDSTFGRDDADSPDRNSSSTLNSGAGLPANQSTPTKAVRTHVAGVFSGEMVDYGNIDNGAPRNYIYPIKSPSGGNFLVTEIFTSSSTYDPVLAYDGTLNSKGTGDIFTIRLHACAVDTSSARVKLRIGGEGDAMTSSSSGETGFSNAAIEVEIQPVAFDEDGFSSYSQPTLTSVWDDYDIIIDYDAYTYDLYKNGAQVSTGNAISNKSDGTAFDPADMYGWAIDAKNCSKKATVLIDRVGLIRPLNDHPDGTEMPPAVSMKWNAAVNSVSSMNLTLIDDDATLKLLSFFNQSSYSDWSLLMFRDTIDRPLWRGFVTGLGYNQVASESTPKITLTAQDSFKNLDHQIPVWELGQGGDAGSTSSVAYNRSEAQNNLNIYFFGASRLVTANQTLGFNEYEDGSGVFVKHLDTRARNRTAHPIQMYLGEDDRGPNDAYDDWDDAITAGHATSAAASRSIHSRWMKDIQASQWFQHTFGRIAETPAITSTLSAGFTKGSTSMSITGAMAIPSGASVEIIDDDGRVDSGVITSSTTTVDATIDRAEWFYERTFVNRTHYEHKFYYIVYVAKTKVSIGDLRNQTISIEGFTDTRLNGDFKAKMFTNDLEKTIAGVDCWKILLADTANGINKVYERHLTTGTDPSRVPSGFSTKGWTTSIIGRRANKSVFTLGVSASTKIKAGSTTLTLPATNFFQRDHSSGATIKVRTLSDDYKHIWVLWADMRNDGNADADAGLRRNEFGLMTPYASNYSLSLAFADENVDGENARREFVDLAIGQDVDLWSMDAMADPLTGEKWSAIATVGSNSESDSKYHDWWKKAGSFVIIDTSKFFNLNTYSNGGKTGQIGGGRKEIGDYLVETEGFPVLIDNYWVQAPTTPLNLDDSASWNANYKHFLSQTTTLATSVKIGDEVIQLNDGIIPTSLSTTSFQIRSEEKKQVYHGQTTSKWTAGVTIPATPDGAGKVVLDVGTTDVASLRAGHSLTISGSTTSPTIDGTYEVDSVDASTGDLTIVINPATTITGGNVTVNADHTYFLRSLVFLGKPVEGTTAPGVWDNTAYGGNNSADALVSAVPSSQIGQSSVDLTISDDTNAGFKDLSVHWGLANVFPMRLMMQLNGFIENPATMTFAEHDKFRVTWMDSLTRNWMQQTAMYGIPNIASIPITKDMNITEQPTGTLGKSGYILSTGATSGGKVLINNHDGSGSASPHGLIDGDVITIMENAQLAADADLKHRQDYTVSDVLPTSFKVTAAGKTATTNDGIWRKVGEQDTFGSVNDARSATVQSIFSSTQATAGLSDEYGVRRPFAWLMGRDGKPSFRPAYSSGFVFDRNNLVVSSLKSESGGQISNVRVFYNGGISFVDYPSASLGSRPRWDIIHMDEVTSSAEALKVAKQEYEKNKAAPMSITAKIQRLSDNHTLDGANDTMLNGARFGYIADQSRTVPRSYDGSTYVEDKAWAWFSLYGGNLFPGAVNALDGKVGDSAYQSGANVSWDNNYFWYGSHSLSNALQIVHIPRNMPKTTDKTANSGYINADGHLRIAIDIDDTEAFSEAENARFHIYLIDYDWEQATGMTAARRSHTRTLVDSNGYYELAIPSTYWANQSGAERVLVSVNYDYLVSLLENRCGSSNRHKNAHDWTFTYSAGHNTDSIFPLGVRKWGTADYWNLRSEWYAPRLHIVDDINFVPATGLTYTDSVLELTSEAMQIRSVSWSIDGRNTEDLSLTLERDMSRTARGGFAQYVLPKVPEKGQKRHQNSGGSNTPVSGGGRSGNPYDGAWDGYGGWGDQASGSLGTAKLTPITTPQRGFGTPDGLTPNTNAQFNIGANNMAANLTNQIKGVMEFNTDSMTGGNFGVLGQKKPSAAPRNNDGAYGLTMSPADGEGIVDEDGITFAGAADGTNAYSAFSASVPVPPAVASNQVQVTGIATMNASSGDAVLYITVSTLEEGILVTKEVTVSQVEKGNIVLFNDIVQGASVNNNTLKVEIARQAGTGDDTAQYAGVTVHNLQVGFDTRSVSGASESNTLTF